MPHVQTTRALDFLCDWLQARFTAWSLGVYLEGPIWNRRDTPAQAHMPGTFQGRIAAAALQRAFPGNYVFAQDLPLVTADMGYFQLVRPPPSALRPTLDHLQGGMVNAESESNNKRVEDAAHPILSRPIAPHSDAATDPPALPYPATPRAHGVPRRGKLGRDPGS